MVAAPLAAATGLVGSLWAPCLGPQVPRFSSVLEKFISGILFRLDSVPNTDLKRVKNTEKTGIGTWHKINKVVPKKIKKVNKTSKVDKITA